MIIKANAKINLSLDIVGTREDGYHELRTVMQSVGLHDVIEMSKNKSGDIKLSCDRREIPTDNRNTAYKAAKLMLEYAGIKDMGVNIFIRKNVPSQAGMGGGSGDAAAVLRGMIALFDIDIPDDTLYDIAARIGADVPFCLKGGTCLCEGIGEVMTELPDMPVCKLLICKPPVGVSTVYAYQEADKYPQEDYYMTPDMIEAINARDIDEIANCVGNRFDDVLHIPEVQIIKSIMLENGAKTASMTGSGSAVFGIFDDEDKLNSARSVLEDYGSVFVTEPTNNVNLIN